MISLEPSRFRSPLLAALPSVAPGLKRRVVRRRRVLLLLGLVLVVFSILVVKARWLSPQGPGYVFFWWHDKVWLAIKGVFFTWLFPVSWIYLLTALCLSVLALVAFTRKRPLIPAWQARVGRLLISWRWSLQVMERWDRGFKQGRRWLSRWPSHSMPNHSMIGGPTLLDVVVEHERRTAMDHLDTLDPSATRVETLEAAADLAFLSARLSSDEEVFEAVTPLIQILLRIDLVRVLSEDPANELDPLRRRLESAIVQQVRGFLPGWFRTVDFSLPVLAMDLALLFGQQGPPKWQDPGREVTRKTGDFNEAWQHRNRILQNVEARRRMLDKSRRRLELWPSRRHPNRPPSADLEMPNHRLEARLAVDIALLAALRFAVPRTALAFLESLEGLRFAFLMAGSPGREEGNSAMESLLTAIEQLPHAFDYRVCSRLLSRKQAEDPDLEEALQRRSKVVTRSDLELVVARHEELRTAAAD